MLVKEIMKTGVITVTLDTLVEECARLMHEHKISGLPVLDPAGRVADRHRRRPDPQAGVLQGARVLPILGGIIYLDSPQEFLASLRRAMAVHAGRLMSRDVVTVRPDDSLEEAATKRCAAR